MKNNHQTKAHKILQVLKTISTLSRKNILQDAEVEKSILMAFVPSKIVHLRGLGLRVCGGKPVFEVGRSTAHSHCMNASKVRI